MKKVVESDYFSVLLRAIVSLSLYAKMFLQNYFTHRLYVWFIINFGSNEKKKKKKYCFDNNNNINNNENLQVLHL